MTAAGTRGWTLAFALVATLVAKWLVFPAIDRTPAVRQPFGVRCVGSLVAGFYLFAVLHACWRACFWAAAIEREDPATPPWDAVESIGTALVFPLFFVVPPARLGCAIRTGMKPPDARACVAMLAILALELAAGVGVLFALALFGAFPSV